MIIERPSIEFVDINNIPGYYVRQDNFAHCLMANVSEYTLHPTVSYNYGVDRIPIYEITLTDYFGKSRAEVIQSDNDPITSSIRITTNSESIARYIFTKLSNKEGFTLDEVKEKLPEEFI